MFHSLQTRKICYNIVTPDHMIIKKNRLLIVSPFPGAVHFGAVIGEFSTFSFVCFSLPHKLCTRACSIATSYMPFIWTKKRKHV